MKTKEELKSMKIQYTAQREAILNVFKMYHQPLTIDKLQQKLQLEVDLSTLYRTLDLFEKKTLIRKTELKEPLQNIYEYNANVHQHHIICTNCMKIQVIAHCPIHEYEASVEKSTGFVVKEHQLNLYGLCPQCQNHK